MNNPKRHSTLKVTDTSRTCPIGETVGQLGAKLGRIPVLSCEGACIRGEIARQAANRVARDARFARACHGELLTAPSSSIARWVATAPKVVLIDGCFMRCHGRILENVVAADRLLQFDALAVHRKYCSVFDADEVPETERLQAAQDVARHVLGRLDEIREPRSQHPVDSTGGGA